MLSKNNNNNSKAQIKPYKKEGRKRPKDSKLKADSNLHTPIRNDIGGLP